MSTSDDSGAAPPPDRVCAGCGDPLRPRQPIFFFDDLPYHPDCVPPTWSSTARSIMGVKGC